MGVNPCVKRQLYKSPEGATCVSTLGKTEGNSCTVMTFDLVGRHEMASNLFDSHRTDFVFAGARDGVSSVVGQ